MLICIVLLRLLCKLKACLSRCGWAVNLFLVIFFQRLFISKLRKKWNRSFLYRKHTNHLTFLSRKTAFAGYGRNKRSFHAQINYPVFRLDFEDIVFRLDFKSISLNKIEIPLRSKQKQTKNSTTFCKLYSFTLLVNLFNSLLQVIRNYRPRPTFLLTGTSKVCSVQRHSNCRPVRLLGQLPKGWTSSLGGWRKFVSQQLNDTKRPIAVRRPNRTQGEFIHYLNKRRGSRFLFTSKRRLIARNSH